MGCCISRNTRMIRDGSFSTQDRVSITAIRECIVDQIHRLHYLIIKCKSDIQTCILEQEKELALLIISKLLCIKNESKELQDLIEHIDNFDDKPPASNHRKIALLEKCRLSLRKLSTHILINDCSLITLKNSEYLEDIKIAVEALKFDKSEIEFQFDSYSRMNEFCETRSGTFKRRKFVKALHKRSD